MQTVNLREKFAKFNDYCTPRVIGELNDCHVKAVKLKGQFIWHHHDDEDELFMVFKGTVRMKFRDREAVVNEGEFIIVPRGVEHLPIADEEVHILLLEPKTTLNPRNVVNERTVSQLERS
jgi:mannose-6-phosphate isomerase-like protein (cupin superfamily)